MKKRETELDLLRLIAMLAVILVHVCGGQVKSLPVTDFNWRTMVFLRSIVTWEVPVYIMISGRFFLDPQREITGQKLCKAIWRLVVAFVLWNIVYQLYYIIAGAYAGLNWKGVLAEAIIGPYHFWYLHMLVLLYAITPFLRKIVQDKRLTEYFILMFLVFQFLTEYGYDLPAIGSVIEDWFSKVKLYFPLGYTGYFILGYYLYKYHLPKKLEFSLYMTAVGMLLLTGFANLQQSIRAGFEDTWYTQYMKPNVIIEAMAIYTFGVQRLSRIQFSEKTRDCITYLSDHSFGVYLIHALMIELLTYAGLTPSLLPSIIMVPICVVIVYVCSHLVIVVLRKVPYIGKRIT